MFYFFKCLAFKLAWQPLTSINRWKFYRSFLSVKKCCESIPTSYSKQGKRC